MNDKQFSIAEEKLNTIIRLLAIQVLKDKKYREQVSLLSSAGMKPKEIAELTGKTPNNVKVTLHLMRKSKRKEVKKNE